MAARATRPWRRAIVIALVLHVALFTLAIRSVKITGPSPEARAIDLQLVQLRPPPLRRERPRTARTTSSSAPAVAAAVAAPPASAPAAPAGLPAPPAQPSPSDGAGDAVRAMLRGSSGCDSARFLRLSEAEQKTCAKWRMAQADPNLQIPAPIDPVKRSWYDATMTYRKNGRYMPIGPPGLGVMKVPALPPGHELLHVGPIHLGLPPGAFNDDEAPPP